MKISQEDRKHADRFLTTLVRNAYGGNTYTAQYALARVIAEERERCAARLDEWANEIVGAEIGMSLQEAARRLRGENTCADEDRGRGETGEENAGRESPYAGKSDESDDVCSV